MKQAATIDFIRARVAPNCRLGSFKYCLWHQFFWSTLPCKLCRMRRSFKSNHTLHECTILSNMYGQLIWMLQTGALKPNNLLLMIERTTNNTHITKQMRTNNSFCNTKKNPQCTVGDFLAKLGKEAILLIFRPTHTYGFPDPLISRSCLTCIKICDLDETFACILHISQ